MSRNGEMEGGSEREGEREGEVSREGGRRGEKEEGKVRGMGRVKEEGLLKDKKRLGKRGREGENRLGRKEEVQERKAASNILYEDSKA